MASNTSVAIREAKLFNFYSRFIWPVHRLVAKQYLTRRCSRCMISEKASPLEDGGICQLCTLPESKKGPSDEELQKMRSEMEDLLRSKQGTGKYDYDALVLFSGGKDSILMIHLLSTM